jgi:hypothetical protein
MSAYLVSVPNVSAPVCAPPAVLMNGECVIALPGTTSLPPTPVPSLSTWALFVVLLALAIVGARRLG